MKSLSEVAPLLLVIQIQIQAVWLQCSALHSRISLTDWLTIVCHHHGSTSSEVAFFFFRASLLIHAHTCFRHIRAVWNKGAEGLPPKTFCRSVRPISIGEEGGQIKPTRIFRPSYGPAISRSSSSEVIVRLLLFFFFFIIHTWKKPATHKLPFGRNTGCFRTNRYVYELCDFIWKLTSRIQIFTNSAVLSSATSNHVQSFKVQIIFCCC